MYFNPEPNHQKSHELVEFERKSVSSLFQYLFIRINEHLGQFICYPSMMENFLVDSRFYDGSRRDELVMLERITKIGILEENKEFMHDLASAISRLNCCFVKWDVSTSSSFNDLKEITNLFNNKETGILARWEDLISKLRESWYKSYEELYLIPDKDQIYDPDDKRGGYYTFAAQITSVLNSIKNYFNIMELSLYGKQPSKFERVSIAEFVNWFIDGNLELRLTKGLVSDLPQGAIERCLPELCDKLIELRLMSLAADASLECEGFNKLALIEQSNNKLLSALFCDNSVIIKIPVIATMASETFDELAKYLITARLWWAKIMPTARLELFNADSYCGIKIDFENLINQPEIAFRQSMAWIYRQIEFKESYEDRYLPKYYSFIAPNSADRIYNLATKNNTELYNKPLFMACLNANDLLGQFLGDVWFIEPDNEDYQMVKGLNSLVCVVKGIFINMGIESRYLSDYNVNITNQVFHPTLKTLGVDSGIYDTAYETQIIFGAWLLANCDFVSLFASIVSKAKPIICCLTADIPERLSFVETNNFSANVRAGFVIDLLKKVDSIITETSREHDVLAFSLYDRKETSRTWFVKDLAKDNEINAAVHYNAYYLDLILLDSRRIQLMLINSGNDFRVIQ